MNYIIKFNKPFFSVIIFLLVLISSKDSFSQEMEPRNYASIPTGLNVGVLTYAYSTGNIVADASAPIKELELNSNTVALGYLRSFSLFGKLCKVQVAVPYVFLSGTAKLAGKDTAGSRSGFADPKIKFVMNLIGSPPLPPQKFAQFKEEFVFGASFILSPPTGQYFPEKLINLGSNRWGFKPEIGASYRINKFFFELFTGVWFFTENNDFVKVNTLKQDPVFSVQGHVSYTFPSRILLALTSVYVNGGETRVNDVVRNDFQKNFRLGSTLSFPLSMHSVIKANYSTGVATRAGGDFSIYSLAYQYSWF